MSRSCVIVTRLVLHCVSDHEDFRSFEVALFLTLSFAIREIFRYSLSSSREIIPPSVCPCLGLEEHSSTATEIVKVFLCFELRPPSMDLVRFCTRRSIPEICKRLQVHVLKHSLSLRLQLLGHFLSRNSCNVRGGCTSITTPCVSRVILAPPLSLTHNEQFTRQCRLRAFTRVSHVSPFSNKVHHLWGPWNVTQTKGQSDKKTNRRHTTGADTISEDAWGSRWTERACSCSRRSLGDLS